MSGCTIPQTLSADPCDRDIELLCMMSILHMYVRTFTYTFPTPGTRGQTHTDHTGNWDRDL